MSLFPDKTSSEVSSLILTILFDALYGSYISIVKTFAQKTEAYTVNDVLDAIQFEYNFHERYQKSNRTSSSKTSSTPCSFCQKSGHSASQCYAKQNKEKASHKHSNCYKNKKSSHHISVTDSTTAEATSSCGDDDDLLRPTSSDSISVDDTNDDNSINLNHYMLLDTGTNISIVNDMAFLHDISHDYIPPCIEDTENRPISHEARGILKLRFPGGKIVNLTAYYAPNSAIGALTLERDGIYLCGKTRTIEDHNSKIYAYYRQFDELPWLSNRFVQFPKNTPKYVVNHLLHKYPLDLVHRLFGHVNVESLRQSFKKKTFKHLTYDDIDWAGHATFQGIDCAQGKAKVHNHIEGARLKYQEHYKLFEYLHSDIFGPVTASSIAKYFITFIDEATSYRWVFPLKDKAADTILDTTVVLVNTIERQYNVKVKAFQFDHGSEYTNDLMTRDFDETGIQYIHTTIGDSRSNGVAERLNLTFLNDCRTLLKASQLPPHLWIFVVQFSAIIRNCVSFIYAKFSNGNIHIIKYLTVAHDKHMSNNNY